MSQHSVNNSLMKTFLFEIWKSLGGDQQIIPFVYEIGSGNLPSVFCVSDLASASIAAASLAIAEYKACIFGSFPEIYIDRRLTSFWFADSIKPIGWTLPSAWDSISGDYMTRDGWIRLHTNAPHHKNAVLRVLDVQAEKNFVTFAVKHWQADELEMAVIQAGGCAAVMYSQAEWKKHDQGKAVLAEPLVKFEESTDKATVSRSPLLERPLFGIRVLDLTRVLSGPVATRFLAGFGADVLRIDPPWWDEPAVIPEVTIGKRCAYLDLHKREDRTRFAALLAQADVLVHGYRADALDHLGLSAAERRRICPGLIDVSLNAYGWTGPWRNRRGFDSLVQMSTGIAEKGMREYNAAKPTPLPVQALDHATGYILAAAVIRGLLHRLKTGHGSLWCTSLARTAFLLESQQVANSNLFFTKLVESDYSASIEKTVFGQIQRLRSPISISNIQLHWDRPAGKLGSSVAEWLP